MKKWRFVASLALVCAFAWTAASPQEPPQPEKLAEGKYEQWQGGHPVADTARQWSITRTGDGYEVKVEWPPERATAMLWMIAAAGYEHLSSEMRAQVQNASITTGMRLHAGQDMTFRDLTLTGKTFRNVLAIMQHKKTLGEASDVELAHCAAEGGKLSCKGAIGKAEIKLRGDFCFLYGHSLPILYAPLLKRLAASAEEQQRTEFVILDDSSRHLPLSRMTATLRRDGAENLAIGDRTFPLERFILDVQAGSPARAIRLWAARDGTVFGVEDPRFAEGRRVLLSEYRKYSNF